MKKILCIALIIVLTVGISVTATMAYLVSQDSEANLFTVGDVYIDLKENYEQGSQLLPNLDINKDVQIKNTGASDAWVFYTYAIPAALDTPADASGNVLHVNHAGANWLGYQNDQKYWEEGQTEATPEEKCWIPDYNPTGNGMPVGTAEVDGITYNVYAVLYNGILPAGETTTVGLTKVYLDPHVDIDPEGQLYWVEKGVATKVDWNIKENEQTVIFVNAYAVQTENFASVQEAYAAYIGQWGELNGAMEILSKPYVSNETQLQTAFEEGWEEIILVNDIRLVGDVTSTFRYTLKPGSKVTLNLNDHGLVNNTDRTDKNGNNILLNVANAELTITGNGRILSKTGEGDDPGILFAGKNGVVTIENGEFYCDLHYAIWAGQNSHVTILDGKFWNDGIEVIYANVNSLVEIQGGFYACPSTSLLLNIKDGNAAKIQVSGGTFVNLDPRYAGDGNLVVSGYTVTSEEQSNGNILYTVIPDPAQNP